MGPHFTFISGSPLKRGEITLETVIWDFKMLTFIDGEPLKAGLLLRGSTVFNVISLLFKGYPEIKVKNLQSQCDR